MVLNSLESVHFIGVGGAGMSAIAWVLLKRGVRVSGSDLSPSHQVVKVAESRNAYGIGRSERVGRLACEIAHRLSLPAETCAQLQLAGELHDIGGNARVGLGALVVAEADESDGSFLLMRPDLAVVTNVEADHLDHWKTYDALAQGYLDFLSRVPKGGKAVVCLDGPGGRDLAARYSGETITYALEPTEAQWQARNLRVQPDATRYECFHGGECLGEVALAVPGRHNAANSLAAIAVAMEQGVEFDGCRRTLAEYHGAARRWQKIGERAGVTVIDDYAHHPTEIAATLAAARAARPDGAGRIVCVFQPHRYTRP
ncbi:MAG: Mur ligase family protein, partial [Candidatus Sumerlaeota bacterium]|nr:Mur ligase family protein [Candidatus Sumerlaeota bacterium]